MHLKDGQLRAYLDRELSTAEMEQASQHLSTCHKCQARYQAVEARAHTIRAHMNTLQPAPNRLPLTEKIARERLEQRHNQPQTEVFPMFKNLFTRRARPFWAVLAVVVLLAVSLAIPSVRAIANNFLGLFRVQQIAVIQVDPNQLESQVNEASANQIEALFADSVTFEGGGQPITVSGPAEASQQAGFAVRLPSESPQPVTYEVQPAFSASMQIDVRRAQGILDELGHSEIRLQKSLDGQNVHVDVPAVVAASYGDCQPVPAGDGPDGPAPIKTGQDCVQFLQVPSPTVNAPPDLDINQLGQAMLEVLGMSQEEAASFAQNIDWASTLVIPVPRYGAQYEEVQVDGAQGTLISSGGGRYALLWIKDGIVYAISGQGNKQAAIDMANTIP